MTDFIYLYLVRRARDNARFETQPPLRENEVRYLYERSFPITAEWAAKRRVEELAARGEEAIYVIGHLIRGAYV